MTDSSLLPRLSRTDADKPGVGIIHLGLGAFYRAHAAIYIAEAMEKSGGDWGIVGVSLKSPNQRNNLAPQGCAYTALELAPSGPIPHHIEVVQDVLVAPENPAAVLDAMSDEAVKIVTLTVTEKGYCHAPSTGKLLQDHPDVIQDLADPSAPASALGFLVRALDIRRQKGQRPFTVMTCDNLPENGHVLRGVVLELAALISDDLASWIASEVKFPCTMVDRIVPATKAEDIDTLGDLIGKYDASPVMMEPFRQWVIEDDFVDDLRPDLGAVGVQLVENVTEFEDMKLRCLNGTHSSLAYLGYLAGLTTISDTVGEPAFARFVKSLWANEIIPGLTPPKGVDLQAYADALFARYQNPSIRHLTWQIAMDGSQKLPQRILKQLESGLNAGRPMSGLILAVAGWMRYVGAVDEKGTSIDVRDPMAERLKSLSDAADTNVRKVQALLSVSEVFPTSLQNNSNFVAQVTAAYEGLVTRGAYKMIEVYND
ncbi:MULTISPECIES: mannitol dehydrogenase family protein [Pacificibacter]|uniref:mannitol dehydrogenase family protein n=1 Tax=Pacificibacter TaxID=1042323 RepID=UPI001C08390C|nr:MULTISPECIES: mannitol dehydrogenase family protein [Pacificibacter]MBU2937016.1 mannitol dehydrogenase family protein [Pacificibacter marinus]MDO6617370.1 mannitol dehydrogenase family protein [Pacificibacter sp. 1_MG-2023]